MRFMAVLVLVAAACRRGSVEYLRPADAGPSSVSGIGVALEPVRRFSATPEGHPCQGAIRPGVNDCFVASAEKRMFDGDASLYDSSSRVKCGEEALVCGWPIVCVCGDGG